MDDIHASRICIGINLPEKAREVVSRMLIHFKDSIEEITPENSWQLEIISIPFQEIAIEQLELLKAPLPLPFFLTVPLTHIGRGLESEQLWAYATATYPLKQLHAMVWQRAQSTGVRLAKEDLPLFTPHIELASLKSNVTTMLADEIVAVTFNAQQLAISEKKQATNQATEYLPLGAVPLTA